MDFAINIFSHDLGPILLKKLNSSDRVMAARVCKAWLRVISAEAYEPYWLYALEYIGKPVKEMSAFRLFEKCVYLDSIYLEGLKHCSFKVSTIKEIDALAWKAVESGLNKDICRFEEEKSKRAHSEETIISGIRSWMKKYQFFRRDDVFFEIEPLIKKLITSYYNFEFVADLAFLEYNCTGRVAFASWAILKLPRACLVNSELLHLLVQDQLIKDDLRGAMRLLADHFNPLMVCHPPFFIICELIREAAYGKKRLDIVEQLLNYIPEEKQVMWVDYLRKSHEEAGNAAEAARIKKKYQQWLGTTEVNLYFFVPFHEGPVDAEGQKSVLKN